MRATKGQVKKIEGAIAGAAALARALDVPLSRVQGWVCEGLPSTPAGHGKPASFDLKKVEAWLRKREAARELHVIEQTSAGKPTAFVKIRGDAALTCERCRVEGAPMTSAREQRLGQPFHRAYRRWVVRRRRGQRTPVELVFFECGRCWTVLARRPVEKVASAAQLPERTTKDDAQTIVRQA
jgi:hypothetical protein